MLRFRFAFLFACLLCAAPAAFAAGIPIRGQVLDAGGAPLAKVRVRLVAIPSAHEAGRLELEGKEPEAVASQDSGADGGFLLQAPEAGMWKVVVGAGDGNLPLQEALAAPLLGELDLPAVRLRRDADPGGLLPGVWHEARRPARRPGASAGPTVPLRVRGADGKPAAGVLVLPMTADPANPAESGRPLGMTGEDGLVELAVPQEAPLDIVLLAADGRQLETQVRPLPVKAPRTPQEARLPALVEFPVQVTSAADSRPLAGALVWRSGDPGSFRRTDARGTARLVAGGTGAFGRMQVLFVEAAAPGFLPDVRERLQTAGQSPLAVSLEPALTLAGLVVTETGAPVAGAEISLAVADLTGFMGTDQRWAIAQHGALVRTGPEGRFRWSGLAPDIEVELRVSKDGFASARMPVTPLRPGEPAAQLRIVLRRGASAFGRVLGPGDQPAAGVQVTLETARSGDPQEMLLRSVLRPGFQDTFETVTDAGGRFDLAHLPAGRYDLSASGRGWAPLTLPGLEIPDEARATDLGTLVLAPGVALEGEVVDAAGKPVEGAEIRLQRNELDLLARLQAAGMEPDAVSGPDGFFRIEDLRAGSTVDLSAERQGYAPGSVTGAPVSAETPLRITLRAVGAVSGRVVDPDGRPIAGAIVQVEGRPWGLGGALTVGREPQVARTDAQGSFRITGVIPGPVSLRANASGWQNGTMAEIELQAAEEKSGLEIVLSPAAILEGQVLSSSGRPVAGAQVEVSLGDRQAGAQTAVTDADGRYVLDNLPPGLRTVDASHADHGTAHRQIELREGESSLDLTLEGGREISGRVVDDAGAPLAGAQIWLIPGSAETAKTASFAIERSRSDGSFRFSVVEDGAYQISTNKEGYARSGTEQVTVDGSSVTGLELRLVRGGAITGRITGVDVADLARVRISAAGNGNQPARTVAVDGSYRIDHLAEGDWWVRAELPGTGLRAEGTVRLEPGASEARLDLEMERGLTLSVRVRRNGAPVAGEPLFLSPGPPTPVETDAEGRFRFQGLSAGTHHLLIGGLFGRVRREETIELQEDMEITIHLPATPASPEKMPE